MATEGSQDSTREVFPALVARRLCTVAANSPKNLLRVRLELQVFPGFMQPFLSYIIDMSFRQIVCFCAMMRRETQPQLFERVRLRVLPKPEAHELLKEADRIRPLGGESFISQAPRYLICVTIENILDPEVRSLEIETPQATTICAMVARDLGVTIVNPLSLSELALASVRSLAFEPMIHFWCYVVHACQ